MNESSLLGGETPTTRLIKIDAMRCGEISFVGRVRQDEEYICVLVLAERLLHCEKLSLSLCARRSPAAILASLPATRFGAICLKVNAVFGKLIYHQMNRFALV
jgi:hypothetical protein